MKNFKLLKLSLLIALLLGLGTVFSQPVINPINILMSPVATDCGIYDVKLNVQQYIEISNISMTLELYDLIPASLPSFPTWNGTNTVGTFPAGGPLTKITLHNEIAGAIVFVNAAGQLKLAWSDGYSGGVQQSFTLPDNTILFTLEFDVNGLWGTSHLLEWNDVLTIDCELSGPNGTPIYPDYWNNLSWIIQNELAIVGADITPRSCPTPNGAIDLHVANGVLPYTYAWTGPNGYTATTQDIFGLEEGFYTVIVTDADFCSVTETFEVTVENPPPPGEVGGPVPIASTVECIAYAVAPTVLPVVQDGCGNVLLPIGPPVEVQNIVGCEGTITWTYTYEDFVGQQFVWTYTYTIIRTTPPAEFGGPVSTGTTLQCAVNTVPPAVLPVVKDVCGTVLTAPNPVQGGTYVDCEGTITYTYTYIDCALLEFEWVYTYTIEHTTPPSQTTFPPTASTVECIGDAVPPTLPEFIDVCGVSVYPMTTDPVIGGTWVDCEGTYTYTYNFTDCAGLSTQWVYTYTIDDNTAPTIIAPDDITVYMNDGCTAINVVLGTPIVADNCYTGTPPPAAPTVTNDAPAVFPEGPTTVTWNVVDCAGNEGLSDTQVVTVIYNTLSGGLHYNNIYPFGPPIIMNNVEITLYDSNDDIVATDITDFVGYEFPGLCAGTYYVEITNNNKPAGGVNMTDAGEILVYALTITNPELIEYVNWLAGDVNNDGNINVLDGALIGPEFVQGGTFNNYWNYYWAGELAPNQNTPPPVKMFVNIGGGNATMDIFGQCTGDFNGNFAPGLMKSASESLTLDYRENMLVSSDTEFELPVYAAIDMEVGAVSLIMNFPADEVEITNVFLTSDPSSPLQYNVTGNELRIGWYSLAPVWLNKGEGLVTLQMKTSSEEGVNFTLAGSELNELADGNFKVIGNASLLIDIPSTSALGIGANLSAEEVDFTSYPNPFEGTTTLTYSLPADGQVLIEVYDLDGSKVKRVVDEAQSAGEYSLKLDASNLQPGVYTAILKLKNSEAKITTRTIKMIIR